MLFNSVMGYCQGVWFSDYDYSFVQAFAEAHTIAYPQGVAGPPITAQALARSVGAQQEIWTYSGTLSASGVRLNPVHVSLGTPTAIDAVRGAQLLRLHLHSGGTVDVPLLPVEIGDAEADQAKAFFVSIPSPGTVESLEVLHKGIALLPVDTAGAPLRASVKAAARQTPRSAILAPGRLTVTWDAVAEPYLTVIHVASDGSRTVISNRLIGGAASIDVSQFNGTGAFEISTSSELGGTLLTVGGITK